MGAHTVIMAKTTSKFSTDVDGDNHIVEKDSAKASMKIRAIDEKPCNHLGEISQGEETKTFFDKTVTTHSLEMEDTVERSTINQTHNSIFGGCPEKNFVIENQSNNYQGIQTNYSTVEQNKTEEYHNDHGYK